MTQTKNEILRESVDTNLKFEQSNLKTLTESLVSIKERYESLAQAVEECKARVDCLTIALGELESDG